MIVECGNCGVRFDDEFRTTICPHGTFAANDGHNHFAHYSGSYISPKPEPPFSGGGALQEPNRRLVGQTAERGSK